MEQVPGEQVPILTGTEDRDPQNYNAYLKVWITISLSSARGSAELCSSRQMIVNFCKFVLIRKICELQILRSFYY